MATKKKMEDALEAILELFEDEDLENDEFRDKVHDLANEGLAAGPKVNAFDEKVKELSAYVMNGHFNMLFDAHEDVAAELNKAEILSPSGKQWTRTNVAKIMKHVRDKVTKVMNEGQAITPTTQPAKTEQSASDDEAKMEDDEPGPKSAAKAPAFDPDMAEIGDLDDDDDLRDLDSL